MVLFWDKFIFVGGCFNMKHITFEHFKLSDKEKESLIEKVSQDITWSDDDLYDSEQDVSNTEIEDQDETEDLF